MAQNGKATHRRSGDLLRRLTKMNLVRLGLAEMALGGCAAVAGTAFHEGSGAAFFTHLGVGLIAAGLLTATVEAVTHQRNHQHLEQLQQTTAVTMLRQFIPEDVFNEVQNQLISKPFARRDLRFDLMFAWKDASREILTLRTSVEYHVQNVSFSPQVFPFQIKEGWGTTGNAASVNISNAYVVRRDERPDEVPNLAAMEECRRVTESAVYVENPVQLQPGESVYVHWQSTRQYFARDHMSLTLSLATRGLTLVVHHPEELVLDSNIHHPDAAAFQETVGPAGFHRWHFVGGFLPFQGLTLAWSPRFVAGPDCTALPVVAT